MGSRSCNTGYQTRHRKIKTHAATNYVCPSTQQTQRCNVMPCAIDCKESAWGAWQQCDKSCGAGSKKRYRSVSRDAAFGGKSCGSLVDAASCNNSPCPESCHVSNWGEWETCSSHCDGGTQMRKRSVTQNAKAGGQGCPGLTQQRSCNTHQCPVDCKLSSTWLWENHGECSVKCGMGYKRKYKHIITQPAHGGEPCGHTSETQACNTQPCKIDCVLDDWGSWSPCTRTCKHSSHSEGGKRFRHRSIKQHSLYGGKECGSLKQTDDTCGDVRCPIDCVLSQWGVYDTCTKTCGTGVQTRRRSVVSKAQFSGAECYHLEEEQQCNKKACPQDCVMNDWSDWGGCSQTCGDGGSQTRTRTQNMAFTPTPDGAKCGAVSATRACSLAPCPVDCVMSQWADWGPCSVSCHSGTRTRHREVQVQPKHDGKPCGVDTETGSCDRGTCPQDCSVTAWGDWTTCSKSCGKGMHSRRREIDTINPGASGYVCPSLSEHRHCNDHACPVNCIEGPFGAWSTCSVKCGGGGTQTRKRTVVQNAAYGGLCLPAEESRACGEGDCAVDCVTADWGAWSQCSKSCGHGVQSRTRQMTTAPENGGKACGDLTQTQTCFHGSCGCSNVFCKFEQHGLFGVDSIQVGHHKAEQKGTSHVCGINPSAGNKCECFCGAQSSLGTFQEELKKRNLIAKNWQHTPDTTSLPARHPVVSPSNPNGREHVMWKESV